MSMSKKLGAEFIGTFWLVPGGMVGGAVLYVIASGQPGFELGGFASNGYGEHSAGGYSLMDALAIVLSGCAACSRQFCRRTLFSWLPGPGSPCKKRTGRRSGGE